MDDDRPALAEPLAVWVLLGLVALAVCITYARIPSADLWNVSVGGVRGGLGRALVVLNFPAGLAAIPIAALAADRLRTRWADVLAVVAVLLCLVMAVPGVVDQDDLDAKAVNLVPALGVALALGLTVAAWVMRGRGRAPRRVPFDRVRIILAIVLLVAGTPWIAADLGFYGGLGGLFEAGEIVPERGHATLRAVHLGHHHGLDGVVLALTALLLTRELVRVSRLRGVLTGYLAVLLVYGLANALNDFWGEQLVKRDVLSTGLPSFLRPSFSLAWLALLAAAVLVYALLRRTTAAPAR
jgi:hypothetical protein